MKIIPGNIHDYYDGCINQLGFSTEGNIFHRSNEEVILNITVKTLSYYPETKREISEKNNNPLIEIYKKTYGIWDSIFLKNHKCKFNYFSILFCGKIYNGIKIILLEKESEKVVKSEFFYSTDDLFNFFTKHEIILREKPTTWKNRNVLNQSPATKKWYEKFFIAEDISDVARENKWVIVSTKIEDISTFTNRNSTLVLNGELKAYQFFKVFDAYSAYQELSMWVDNLAYPGNVMLEVADEYRIAAHGFDHKYAFKKEPSKKK